jgi:hypothetical protein
MWDSRVLYKMRISKSLDKDFRVFGWGLSSLWTRIVESLDDVCRVSKRELLSLWAMFAKSLDTVFWVSGRSLSSESLDELCPSLDELWWFSGRGWPILWINFAGSLDKVCRVSGRALLSLWKRFAESLDTLWRVSGQALPSLWASFAESLDKLWRVSGRGLPSLWTRIAESLACNCDNTKFKWITLSYPILFLFLELLQHVNGNILSCLHKPSRHDNRSPAVLNIHWRRGGHSCSIITCVGLLQLHGCLSCSLWVYIHIYLQ